MATRWTPTMAGLVTLVAMCVIGIAVAALARAAAYVDQARRGER